ncbi:hypothetical protein K0M31_009542, partial [Melipona bicolor]
MNHARFMLRTSSAKTNDVPRVKSVPLRGKQNRESLREMVYSVKIADEICGVIAIPDTARRPEKLTEETVVSKARPL